MPAHVMVLLAAMTTFAVVRYLVGPLIRKAGREQEPGDDEPTSSTSWTSSTSSTSSTSDAAGWTALDEVQFRRCADRSSP